ncbi:hypothetical protein U1Q18_031172, partial [Sarracenia purpurea var. burkii]
EEPIHYSGRREPNNALGPALETLMDYMGRAVTQCSDPIDDNLTHLSNMPNSDTDEHPSIRAPNWKRRGEISEEESGSRVLQC